MSSLLASMLTYVAFLYMLAPGSASNGCSLGSFGPGGSWGCQACPAGQYCPYISLNQPGLGTLDISCPRGTYVPYTGAASVNECLKCDIGTYSGNGFAKCWDCPRGTYCDTKGTDSPAKCPPGTYQPNTGATSIKACVTCPPGTLHPLAGGYVCYPCPNGCSCPDPAQIPVPLSNSTNCMGNSATVAPPHGNSSTQGHTLPSFTLPAFTLPSFTFPTFPAFPTFPVFAKTPSTPIETPETPSLIRLIRIASASNSSTPFSYDTTSPIKALNSASSIRCSSTAVNYIFISLLVWIIAAVID